MLEWITRKNTDTLPHETRIALLFERDWVAATPDLRYIIYKLRTRYGLKIDGRLSGLPPTHTIEAMVQQAENHAAVRRS